MQTRFLTVLFGVTFVLTLLFAVAAGAQEDATVSPGGGGVQVQQEQQVQQQQVGPAAAPAPFGGPLAHANVKVTKGGGDGTIDDGDHLKISGDYDVKVGASITIEDDDGTQATFTDGINAKITETDNGIEIEITKNPTTVPDGDPLETGNVRAVTSTDVQREGSGSGNNDGGSSSGTTDTTGTDTTGTTGTSTAQADDTTTGTADASADPATADAAAGDGANRDGSFRCESFLHVVRDENGNLRRQYRNGDDEVIVQRFEQCLEADVLANTIPNRLLPDTGGPPLLFGGGALLLVAVMVLAGRIIRR